MSLKLAIILVVSLQVNSKVVPQNPGQNRFQTPLVGPGPYNEHLERVFEALQKLIVFYNKEYKNLLVDGVYGLRVLEGVVDVILQEHKKGILKIPVSTQNQISKLGVVASRTAKMTYPYLKKMDPHYFEIMGFTVLEPWRNIKPLKKMSDDNFDVTMQNYVQMDMDEESQDKCFNALTGDRRKGIKPCTVSDYCWKVNTVPGQKSYQLTHQVLYFLLGQVKGCSKVFESRFKAQSYTGGIDRFLSISCHAMLPEMNKQEEYAIKTKNLGEIDLYMEQAVVCGMIGYSDFFSLDRLNRILAWRHKDGCFGYTDEIGGKEDEDIGGYGQRHVETQERQTMRKLTVSRDLEGGCEVHSTGVGTGLFALYLRWLLHLYTKHSTSHIKADEELQLHKKYYDSSNLIYIFLIVAVSVIILLIFSKRMGLRFHRSKFVRNLCPCIF